MKKFTITLVLMSCLSMVSFSQKIALGVRAGVNMSTVGYSGNGVYGSPNFKTGIFGGAYLTAMLGGKFGVQPEVLFSMQGYGSGSAKVNMSYVNIPVLLRLNLAKILYLHAGPQFGILMSAKEKLSGTTTDVKDSFKSSDIAAIVGAGVDLPFGLDAGIRFNVGLSNIDDTGASYSTRTRMFQIFVGYKILGKKK